MNNEILGIIGTLFILVGFTSNKESIIRIFDMIGALLFILYGAMIGAISTVILNACLVLVNGYKLAASKKA